MANYLVFDDLGQVHLVEEVDNYGQAAERAFTEREDESVKLATFTIYRVTTPPYKVTVATVQSIEVQSIQGNGAATGQ